MSQDSITMSLFSLFEPPPPPPLPTPPPNLGQFLLNLFHPPLPPPPPAAVAADRVPTYLIAFIVISMLAHCWEQYLRWRTLRRLKIKGVPAAVKAALGDVDEAEYARAQEYGTAKNNFGFLADNLGFGRNLIDLYLTPLLWTTVTKSAVLAAGLTAEHEVARLLVLSLVATPLGLAFSMPLSAYRTFRIEADFGFNKHSVRTWLSDMLKEAAVGQVTGFAMLVPLVLVLRNSGELAWLYAWGFITFFVLLLNMIYPTMISPLFNTFKPLAAGEVRTSIEALVSATGLPCDKLFEVDGSRQSRCGRLPLMTSDGL